MIKKMPILLNDASNIRIAECKISFNMNSEVLNPIEYNF